MLAMLCTAECATNGRLRRVVCGSALLHSPPGFGNCQGSPFRRADLTRRVLDRAHFAVPKRSCSRGVLARVQSAVRARERVGRGGTCSGCVW